MAAGYRVLTASPTDEHLPRLEALTGQPHQALQRLAPRSRNGFSDIACLNELSRIYRDIKPDLIVHFTIKPNIFGGIAASRIGIPYIAVITGLGYTFLHGGWRNQRLVPWLYKQGLGRAAATIFYNTGDRELFRQRGIIPVYAGVRINGSGVDMQHFTQQAIPQINTEGVRFLYLGRILRDKGLMELFAACKTLKKRGIPFHLTIAGSLEAMNPEVIDQATFLAEVDAVNSINNQQNAKEKAIEYIPEVADVRPLLAKCHAFVLPSYREGLSIAGAEALATGRPMVVTDVPGCTELISSGKNPNGLLVKARNIPSLVKAMEQICQLDQTQLQTMGNRSRQWADEIFSAEITTGKFLAILQKTL